MAPRGTRALVGVTEEQATMTYAVHHVDAEGCGQLEDTGSLDDALARVEELRNDGAVSGVRVLKEVPIEVRTYYRVVAVEEGGATGEGTAVPAAPATAAQADVDPPFAEVSSVDDVPHDTPGYAPAQEPERPAPVFGEPPSGAVVMGPPPATAAPETGEVPADPAPEPRRALFGRS